MNLNKLTLYEVSNLLNVSEKTVYNYRNSLTNPMPFVNDKESKNPVYVWSEVLAWYIKDHVDSAVSKEKAKRTSKRSSEDDGSETEQDLKKRKLAAEAKLSEIEVEKELRTLIPTEEAEKLWSVSILKAKTRLLGIPATVARRLYDGQTIIERQDEIESELRIALNELSVSLFEEVKESEDDEEGL